MEIPRESVRLMAESTGLELSDEVAALLAEDVCYRLREATQVCCSHFPSLLLPLSFPLTSSANVCQVYCALRSEESLFLASYTSRKEHTCWALSHDTFSQCPATSAEEMDSETVHQALRHTWGHGVRKVCKS